MRKRIAGVLALLMLTAACDEGSVQTGGPLILGGDPGTLCLPSDQGRRMTVGMDRLRNTADGPLTITSVSLAEADGVSLIEAVLLPMPVPNATGTRAMVGNSTSYPPETTAPEWNLRIAAEEAMIGAGEERALVFGLDSEASSSLNHVEVEYEDDSGKRYAAQTSTKIIVRPTCD